MAALTNPGTKVTEFAGNKKLLAINGLAIGSTSDTLTVTAADNNMTSIDTVVGSVSGGLDAAFSYCEFSHSGAVITIESFEQDGTVATDFTGTTVNMIIVGE